MAPNRRTHTHLTVLALAAAVVGCQDHSTRPDALLDPPTGSAEVDGRVATDITMRLAVTWNVDQSPDALLACRPRPGLAEGAGTGRAHRIGVFQVVQMDHCSIDLAATPPVVNGVGVFEFATPDGSSLFGTYTFVGLPAERGGGARLVVEGGEGRFAGARGELIVQGLDGLVCDDPSCLTNAFLETELEGTLSLPRGGPGLNGS